MISKPLKLSAAIFCIIYIVIQSFQAWVFKTIPDDPDPVKQLLSGHDPLNITRSWFMLFAMFGLWFVFFTICFSRFQKNKAATILAFTGFSLFCLLEVMLRSTELLYTQIQLPLQYLQATDDHAKQAILDHFNTFQQIQGALYFPLGLGQIIGSLCIAVYFPNQGVDRFIKIIFLLNAIRLILRTLGNYFDLDPLGFNSVYGDLYLPMVILIDGGKAFWLVKTADEARTT